MPLEIIMSFLFIQDDILLSWLIHLDRTKIRNSSFQNINVHIQKLKAYVIRLYSCLQLQQQQHAVK